jgi:CCR4-NOT transcription complex subunit 2
MWSGQAARNLGGAAHRGTGTPIAQQTQQDDMYASRLASAQGSFRFGNQGAAAQAQGQAGVADDFPPLNRAGNGDIGAQDRRGSVMTGGMGFGAQGSAASSAAAMHANRAGNGLLNALSGANTRAADVRTPTAIGRPQDTRSPTGGEDQAHYREDGPDGTGSRNPHGAIGNNPPSAKGKEEDKAATNQVQDPLEGMAPIDKWGLKGLRTLMNNFPDYNALTCGLDPTTLGIDMRSQE